MSRLSAERLDELYTGTLKIVSMRGFDNLTMDEIAAATKCSKATLYRQWGSKASLVVQALQCTAQSRLELADTGSLRGDLRHMFAVRDRGDNDDGTQLMGAILHAMKQDPELAAAVRQEILQPIHERIGTLLQRAINRGEIAEDSPGIPHVNLALMAPFVLQVALTGVEPDDEFLYGYIDGLVLPALGIH
ncbi:TetR/AcrR family transcriptional regulator [Aeromicrobium sp.]|uniref:TetR/AcrR family transcriptional regulator n=1 Tax=Aeromicrobium sp. TaxID=1871063 RepID=UPI0019A99D69|nr:TetR/AcrR family transcriptional regulator [Aeromicrobium sp.]MBC7632667.1 TetR/AcrR family transcriptional regulator [Aeromicrobium sp.]